MAFAMWKCEDVNVEIKFYWPIYSTTIKLRCVAHFI